MALKTKEVSSRRSTIADLKEKHLKLLQSENIEGKEKFIPKMAYIPKGGLDRVISFFLSEILGGQDIYTEFTSKELVPDDTERTLWKWEFNPQFETAYEKSEPHPATGHCRYLVPVDELVNVADPSKHAFTQEKFAEVTKVVEVEKSPLRKAKLRTVTELTAPEEVKQAKIEFKQEDFIIPHVIKESTIITAPKDEDRKEPTDAYMDTMTVRDKAAIEWRLPVSEKAWLNELINENFKQTMLKV